jgi:hypothetical protein
MTTDIVEQYLTTPELKDAKDNLIEKIKIYQETFKLVNNITKNKLKMPGTIFQVNFAANALKNNNPIPETILLEAIHAGKALLVLEKAKMDMCNLGIPYLVTMEISRRILSADIIGSKPLNIPPFRKNRKNKK